MTLIDESIPDMGAFGQSMNNAIQHFSNFKSIKIKNSEKVSKKFEEINQQRLKFREFASESTKQSSKLSRYAEDVVVFAECCADNRYSKDDLLDLLRLRLNEAKQYKEITEELQLKIKHIIKDLQDINKYLTDYADDIYRDPRLLDSETKTKLTEKESVKEKYSASSKVNATIAICGFAIACIAAPLSGGTSVMAAIAATCVDTGIVVTTAGSSIALGTRLLAGSENGKISDLNRKLRTERDHLFNVIEGLNNGLAEVVVTCRKLSGFWEEQTEAVKNLINKLESLNDPQEIRNTRMVSVVLSSRWKKVVNECKEFNHQVWSQLDKDALLGV